MTKILGLTGGIASGKSTISNYFKKLNVPIVDADQVARDVMSAGQPVVEDIRRQFGEEYILKNGEINRSRLGDTVFTYPEKRHQLNAIVQGEIRKEMKRRTEAHLAEGPPLIVIDVPLLYEGNYDKYVDLVMVVYVDEETQKERLLKRNPELSEEDAINRIQSQMPLEEKAKRADVVIDNNGPLEDTLEQVKTWVQEACPSLELIE